MKSQIRELLIASSGLTIILFVLEKMSPGFVLMHMRITYPAIIAVVALVLYIIPAPRVILRNEGSREDK